MTLLLTSLVCTFPFIAVPEETACAVIPASAVGPDAQAAELLSVQLHSVPEIRLVERSALQAILTEHTIAGALAPEGSRARLELGRLVKADLLVFLRERKRNTGARGDADAIDLTIAETRQGLRLVMQTTVWDTAKAEETCKGYVETVRRALGLASRPDLRVFAVPPFESGDIAPTYDQYRLALARLLQEYLLESPGTVVVELAEAKALAQESAIAERAVARALPFYAIGSYKTEYEGKSARLRLNLELRQGETVIGSFKRDRIPMDSIGTVLRTAALAVSSDAGHAPPTTAPAGQETRVLTDRAEVFRRLGEWQEAMPLYECVLLLDSSNLQAHLGLFLAHLLHIPTGYLDYRSLQKPGYSPTLRVTHCELALDHLEYLLAARTIPPSLSAEVGTFTGCFHLSGYDTARDPEHVVSRHRKAALRLRDMLMTCLLRKDPPTEMTLLDRKQLERHLIQQCKAWAQDGGNAEAYERLYQVALMLAARKAPLRSLYELPIHYKPPAPTAYEAFLRRMEQAPLEPVRSAGRVAGLLYEVRDQESFDHVSRKLEELFSAEGLDPATQGSIRTLASDRFRRLQAEHGTLRQDGGASVARFSSLREQLRFRGSVADDLTIHDWIDCAGRADVLATSHGVLRLKDDSTLAPIETDPASRLHWDGRYVWVLGGKWIRVCDPFAGRIAEFDQPEVLQGTTSAAGQLVPIRPGIACFIGYVSQQSTSRRSWAVFLELDSALPGGQRVAVIYEAREQRSAVGKSSAKNVAIFPTWAACLLEPGIGTYSIMVGEAYGFPRLIRFGRPVYVMTPQWPLATAAVVHDGQLLIGAGGVGGYKEQSAIYRLDDWRQRPNMILDFGERVSQHRSFKPGPYYSDVSVHGSYLHLLANPRVGGRPAWVAVDLDKYAAATVVDTFPADMRLGEPHRLCASKRHGLVLVTMGGAYKVDLPSPERWPRLETKTVATTKPG